MENRRKLTLLGGDLSRRLIASVPLLVMGGVVVLIALGTGRYLALAGLLFMIFGIMAIGGIRVSVVDGARREVRQFRLWKLGLGVDRYELGQFAEVRFHIGSRSPWDSEIEHRGTRLYAVSLQGHAVLELSRGHRLMAARRQAEQVAKLLHWPLVDESVAPVQRREPETLGLGIAEQPVHDDPARPAAPVPTVVRHRVSPDEVTLEFPSTGPSWGPWLLLMVFVGVAGSWLGWRALRADLSGSSATVSGFLVLGPLLVMSGRMVFLAPIRWRVRVNPDRCDLTRITLLGNWSRRLPLTAVEEVVVQGESIVLTTDRARHTLALRTPHRILFPDLPSDLRAAIASGQRPFPPSPDAQFAGDLIRYGLTRHGEA